MTIKKMNVVGWDYMKVIFAVDSVTTTQVGYSFEQPDSVKFSYPTPCDLYTKIIEDEVVT